MRVEDVLRDIQSDRGNVLYGRLLQVTVRHRYLGTQMPSGASTPSPKTPTQLSNGCRPKSAPRRPLVRSPKRSLTPTSTHCGEPQSADPPDNTREQHSRLSSWGGRVATSWL